MLVCTNNIYTRIIVDKKNLLHNFVSGMKLNNYNINIVAVWPWVLCPVSCVLCPVSYVMCPVSLCIMSCVLYYVMCIVSCVLCPVSYVMFPVSFVLCPMSFVLNPAYYVLCPVYYAFCLMSIVLYPIKSSSIFWHAGSTLSGFPIGKNAKLVFPQYPIKILVLY